MKLDKNLRYREYDNTLIILPEGEDCFVLDGIAFKVFKLLSNNLDINAVKYKLLSDKNSTKDTEKDIDKIIDKMVELKILV